MERCRKIDSYNVGVLSYEDLKNYTSQFSEANYIGEFQFGKVYHGRILEDSDGTEARDVTVKIWEETEYYKTYYYPEDNGLRLEEEVFLLKNLMMESHPNLVKVIGYCSEGEHLGVVYDSKPLNTVHNLMLEESFNWIKRIKVALEFACLVEYFHSPREPYYPYMLRNIDAHHIMLDQDYNSKLYDFSMIAGGIFPSRREVRGRMYGCHGYYHFLDLWSEKHDVFAFGVLLLCLISRRLFDVEKAARDYDTPTVFDWAWTEYKATKKSIMGFCQPNRSLVHPIFKADLEFYSSDGPKITKLAMQCVKRLESERPTMKQVVDHLLNLHVVRLHADRLGISNLVRLRDRSTRETNCPLLRKLFFKKMEDEEFYRGKKLLGYEELERYTNNFSEDNFIGKFQFGRVYRGNIEPADEENGTEPSRQVTVKIWEDPKIYRCFHPDDNVKRLKDELVLQTHLTMDSHPQIPTLYGYCSEGEHLGIVYDLKPLDTLRNLMLQDGFSWDQRIKVALQFACLIEYFHFPREPYRPYLIRNVDAAHIMLDQDHNSKLFDFSMIAGGIFPEKRDDVELIHGCPGYIDPAFAYAGTDLAAVVGDCWSEKNDVFAFGVLLLELIAKKVYDLEEARKEMFFPYVHEWAKEEYKARKSIMSFFQRNPSLVHPSFEADPYFYSSDGPQITKLAMRCVKYWPYQRPTMKQVVDQLLNLHISRHHVDRLGIGQLIRGFDPNLYNDKPLEVVRQLICMT